MRPGDHDNLDITHVGDRFKEQHPQHDPDTMDIEDPPTSRVPRKRQAIEALEAEVRRGNEQTMTADAALDPSIIDASHHPAKIRRIEEAPSILSEEKLRALNISGEKKEALSEWLDGSTQYAVETETKKKRDQEHILHIPEPPRGPPIPMRLPDRFQCINCQKQFTSRSELRHHARRYEKRPYECSQCDKSFLYPKDLRRHETTHSGTKTFRCNTCPKAFSRKDNLRRHVTNEHPGVPLTLEEVNHNSSLHEATHDTSELSAGIPDNSLHVLEVDALRRPSKPKSNAHSVVAEEVSISTAPKLAQKPRRKGRAQNQASEVPDSPSIPPQEASNQEVPASSIISSQGAASVVSARTNSSRTDLNGPRQAALAQQILKLMNTNSEPPQGPNEVLKRSDTGTSPTKAYEQSQSRYPDPTTSSPSYVFGRSGKV